VSTALDNTNHVHDVQSSMVGLSVGGTLTLSAWQASSFYSRLRGLHGVPPLKMGEALIIMPCDSIHTLSMRSSIDVMFVDETGVILLARTVPRFRFVRCKKACAVIEMPEGSLVQLGLSQGLQLNRDKGQWG